MSRPGSQQEQFTLKKRTDYYSCSDGHRKKRIKYFQDKSWGKCSGPFLFINKTWASSLENVAFQLEFNKFKNDDWLERINHIWKRFECSSVLYILPEGL